jgi:hypothetical protein
MYRIDERPHGVLELTIIGRLQTSDYDGFGPRLTDRADRRERGLRLLIRLEDMEGIEPAAVWDDLRLSADLLGQLERVAIIGDADWHDLVATLSDPIINGEARFFRAADDEEARRWVSEGAG